MKSAVINQANVLIPVYGGVINGNLWTSADATGLIVFYIAGSGSFSVDEFYPLAEKFAARKYNVLLVGLLTSEEENIFENTFNISLLTRHLISVNKWIENNKPLKFLKMGVFAIGTGAAAAIRASAVSRTRIKCVVSLNGRPDMAGETLKETTVPVLMIASAFNSSVIEANQNAMRLLNSPAELRIIPGSAGLFDDPRQQSRIVHASIHWFDTHLKSNRRNNISKYHSKLKV